MMSSASRSLDLLPLLFLLRALPLSLHPLQHQRQIDPLRRIEPPAMAQQQLIVVLPQNATFDYLAEGAANVVCRVSIPGLGIGGANSTLPPALNGALPQDPFAGKLRSESHFLFPYCVLPEETSFHCIVNCACISLVDCDAVKPERKNALHKDAMRCNAIQC